MVNGGLIRSDRPVTLIGPTEVRRCDFDAAMAVSDGLIAADGGAEKAIHFGHLPDWVVGDFDSFDSAGRIPEDRLLRLEDQDSTDFQKCLSAVDAPLILAVGFLGRRIDHELAVFAALVQEQPGRVLLIGSHDAVFHCPPTFDLDVTPGSRFSLFPMAPVQAKSDGLRWPLEGLDLAPLRRISTSNEATGPVSLSVDGPGLLILLPRTALPALLARQISVPAKE
ncbi:MAG: thiamine diphosphokinase [Pseudomonadota bacterium]